LTRVAAVDLGTNSTRLLVADVEDGRLQEVVRRLAITRLGENVDERRRLLPLPVARVRNVLVDYRRELEALGATRTLAVATSAVRDAENGEAFLGEVEWSYGFVTRLLDGLEEAAITFRGVASGSAVEPGALIVDIGGGSTELVLGGPDGVDWATSLQVGSVRLSERFLHDDPPTAAELNACARHVRAALPALRPHRAIGVAGTVTTLATLDLGLAEHDPARTHGHVLTRTAIGEQLDRLGALPLAERRAVPGLEPERAPVILGGIVVLDATLDASGLEEIAVSERDLLDGAALAAAELPEPEEGPAPPGAYTCC
jgi:exopolyphosphatase / guanosine-5'-triphosphate,3'-diphosphate pyrophosphatase